MTELTASDIYRRKAELLRGMGNECVVPMHRDSYWALAALWDSLAAMAEQRETKECLGQLVESLNTGRKYLTLTESTTTSTSPTSEESSLMMKNGKG
jgi:hypothetical protein